MPATGGKGSAHDAFEEGTALEARGDLKHALTCFKLASEREPSQVGYIEAVARVLELMGKTSQATEWYMRAAQVQEDEANPQVTKAAWIHDLPVERAWVEGLQPNRLSQDEVVPAAERLERLLAHFGPDAAALRKLALLLGRLARIAEATRLIDEARKAELRGLHWR